MATACARDKLAKELGMEDLSLRPPTLTSLSLKVREILGAKIKKKKSIARHREGF